MMPCLSTLDKAGLATPDFDLPGARAWGLPKLRGRRFQGGRMLNLRSNTLAKLAWCN